MSPGPARTPTPAGIAYLLHVGQVQSGSMGPKSFWYCFFFNCKFPVGTRAEPNRWAQRRAG